MNSQLVDFDRLLLVLFAVLLFRISWELYAPSLRCRWKRVKARLPRRWKPRSPKDCPHCCQGLSLESAQSNVKEIPTVGFTCFNPQCDYFGATNDQVHALVGHGKRGIKHNIQHFRCQWCGKDFTCRRNTPLYYLQTASDRIKMVLWLMTAGVDASVCRPCPASIVSCASRPASATGLCAPSSTT